MFYFSLFYWEEVVNILTNDAAVTFANLLLAVNWNMFVSHFCQSERSMNALRATLPKSTCWRSVSSRLTVPGIWWWTRLPMLHRDLRWQIWTQWWTRGESASQHRWVHRSAQPMSCCKRFWCTAGKESRLFKCCIHYLKRRLVKCSTQCERKLDVSGNIIKYNKYNKALCTHTASCHIISHKWSPNVHL